MAVCLTVWLIVSLILFVSMTYAMPEVLVSTQWLADRLEDPTLRIVEVDMSVEVYENVHIPGAVFWSYLSDLMRPDLRLKLETTEIEALLSQAGITPQTTVVAYGSYPGTGGFIFWLLKLFGHRDVRVLNGGHRQWMAENRPVTSELSTYPPSQYQANTSVDRSLRATVSDVEVAMRDSNSVLLDVRSLPEFEGELFLMDPPQDDERAGHIPGAVHIEQVETLTELGAFKSFEDLKSLFAMKGVTSDKKIISYCAIGARAGYMWFVLTHLLGYPNVYNYDGSWNEWSRLPNAEIEKGRGASSVYES